MIILTRELPARDRMLNVMDRNSIRKSCEQLSGEWKMGTFFWPPPRYYELSDNSIQQRTMHRNNFGRSFAYPPVPFALRMLWILGGI